MFLGRLLERLGDDDDPDVEENPDSGLKGNKGKDRLNRSGETEKADEDAVQGGIAGLVNLLLTWAMR